MRMQSHYALTDSTLSLLLTNTALAQETEREGIERAGNMGSLLARRSPYQ